ncbi:MAG: hypothetical protein V2A62_02625 [Candidatus Woesearchaeota archaeon]
MRNKSAQITIFIIIGIVLLALSATIFYLVNTLSKEQINQAKQENYVPEMTAVKSYTENCLEKTTKEGIYYNFLHGGFFRPNFITSYDTWKIPYYFYLEEDIHPLKERIELDLSNYTENYLRECLDHYKSFKNIQIDSGKVEIKTSILEGKVKVNLKMPLEVTSGKQSQQVNNFEANLNLDINRVINILNQFNMEQEKKPNEVMLTYLTEDSITKGYKFNLIFQKDQVIYLLKFSDIIIQQKPLQVQFSSKYDWYGEMNQLVDLKPIGRVKATVGEEFNYLLNATEKNLRFDTDSELFSIEKGGKISFTPAPTAVGTHTILVNAFNENSSDQELMILLVQKKE